MDPRIYLLVVFLVGMGVFLLYRGFNRMHKYRMVADTPTSKIRSMAMGIVEIFAKALCKAPIKTPFSQIDCVYYRYEIKEYKVVRSGKTTSYKWVSVARGDDRIPFFAKDDTGAVYIEPTGAEFNINVRKCFYQKAGIFAGFSSFINSLKNWNRKDYLNVSKLNLQPVDPKHTFSFGTRVGDRKYYEYFVGVDDNVYILGTAANDARAPNNVLIRKGQNNPMFMISDKSEQELVKHLKRRMILSFVLGSLSLSGGLIMILWILGVF